LVPNKIAGDTQTEKDGIISSAISGNDVLQKSAAAISSGIGGVVSYVGSLTGLNRQTKKTGGTTTTSENVASGVLYKAQEVVDGAGGWKGIANRISSFVSWAGKLAYNGTESFRTFTYNALLQRYNQRSVTAAGDGNEGVSQTAAIGFASGAYNYVLQFMLFIFSHQFIFYSLLGLAIIWGVRKFIKNHFETEGCPDF
jgi:hypothetical protein